ncbi:MAG: sigma-70 family RNA polymerase sigma factor [Rhizobiales bacterium]|nr:sigma-70 family RNA polymerase sigma factor [Hyphomicrobiales bacterium]
MQALAGRETAGTGEDLAAGADAALLERVRRADKAAFSTLLSRHYDAAYRVAYRMMGRAADCEDIVQDAFVKLWTNPGQIREGQALRAWLMRVVSNLSIDRLRRKPMLNADEVPEPASDKAGPDLVALRNSVSSEIDKAIAMLPERQRMALIFVYYEGLSNRDAAAALELSVDALESLLARARRSLKKALAGQWQDLLADIDRLD